MMRVLHTSNGVVMAAATPPAILPHAAASIAAKSFTDPELVLRRAKMSLSRSYRGNCKQVNGILSIRHESVPVLSFLQRSRAYLPCNCRAKTSIESLPSAILPNGFSDFPTPRSFCARLTPLFHHFRRYPDHTCRLMTTNHLSLSLSDTLRGVEIERTISPPDAESICKKGAVSSRPKEGNSLGN